ncbi:MAG: aminotransferase class IV [Proteobacteria bacterium]|nr:aminotransferase class IV [Pseudomonadota bacterium]
MLSFKKMTGSEGYDNVLLLNSHGKISEAPTACVFFIKDNVLFTPDLGSDILESITRKFIIVLAKTEGIKVEERNVDRSEIYNCDEAFLCGTGCEILPIVSIDRYLLNNRHKEKKTLFLIKKYFDVMYGKNLDFKDWLEIKNSFI